MSDEEKKKVVSEPPPPLRGLCPELSPLLERIVLRGLERSRERRWRSLVPCRLAALSAARVIHMPRWRSPSRATAHRTW